MLKHILAFVFVVFIGSTAFTQSIGDTDKTAIKKVVTDFYKWYEKNGDNLYDFKLYKGKKTNDLPPYIINWKSADSYFAYIKKNIPQLGDSFIAYEKDFFKNCQKDFDEFPDEEIASGFDYDRFTDSQEISTFTTKPLLSPKAKWAFNKTDKINTVEVKINTPTYSKTENFSMNYSILVVKEKMGWKIASHLKIIDPEELPTTEKI